MASTARKFRHGDRVELAESAPALLRGRVWVLLDRAPLTRPGLRSGRIGLVSADVRTTTSAHGTGNAWWLQDAETGKISPNYIARESIMALKEA